MNWFKISLQLNRFPINRAQEKLWQIQKIPEDVYGAYLEEQSRHIVEYHLQHNEHYRQFYGSNNFTSWEEVPVMQKKDLQRPLDQRLSKPYTKSTCYIGKTSGSSGHPFIFAKDRFCHALTWAEFIDRYQWIDIDLNSSLQARFYGIPLDFYGNLLERFKDRVSLRRRFNVFDLSEKKMLAFLERFRKSPFDYVNGYTSAIVLFAKYLQKKNLKLKDLCPTLKVCIVTSEKLFEKDKQLIETFFGVPVVNEYGASEVGLIAFENSNGEWIVNSESLFIEILDENNQILPNGEEGRIVITSLYNKAHPMIRYDIGDTGTLMPGSTLKRPILKKLTGRTNDVAKLADGKVVPGLTFYYVTKSIIEDAGSIKEFVIVQTALDTFKIEYVSEQEFTPVQVQRILTAIETFVGKNLQVELERKNILQRNISGKLKQFTSLI
ncbi:phenylacetate--CoA ligase family protein [Antarcticibacterium flavum]|uniref:Phenylacetate--CoA ligase family protein n=1 Tax=Antarcticibacterium flavum TaxID=2058175 RepID=A0A5B7X2P4_9FLAO|nr:MULTISPECIES: phenylacetate--CoA ligase family protein [Antarcticibacterium]MCM4159201.1 AMP-binding protein [Antarcticibacterium sp. W02-3]QCY69599.1 phenylacetate--CoA ligase family protein [Antarcticibacterium flavum]